MRVVLDSNVLVSAALTPNGLSGRVLEAWRARRFTLCTSVGIVDETVRVLTTFAASTRFGVRLESLATLKDQLALDGDFPTMAVEPISAVRDPKDNMVIECALGCEADLIVTNDEDLLALKAYEGVGIVTLRDFLRTLGD